MGDQLSLPAAIRSHNFEGLDASPPNLQLIPTIAIGTEGDDESTFELLPLVDPLGAEPAPSRED
jgi:hypothetical protein